LDAPQMIWIAKQCGCTASMLARRIPHSVEVCMLASEHCGDRLALTAVIPAHAALRSASRWIASSDKRCGLTKPRR